MKKNKLRLNSKKNIAFLIIFIIFLYFIFAYNYFYYRLHQANLPWPNDAHSYIIKQGKSEKVYVALGDSLTYGIGTANFTESYPYRLSESFAKNESGLELLNFSFPGFKTKDIVNKIDETVAAKPDIITILIGTNDTHGFIKKSDFETNYNEILSRLSSQTKAKIYVINEPYIGSRTVQLPPFKQYFDHVTRTHNKIIKRLSEKYKLEYIDLYSDTSSQFKKSGEQYSKDGFHPSAEGYRIWSEQIINDINN